MTTFETLGLKEEILKAVKDLGFEHPTPVQEKSIPLALNFDNDIIALAQTGTGKTAAFSLPIIHEVDPDESNVQALILCPTRELCIQISNDIKNFTKYLRSVEVISIYGGESIDRQIKALRRGGQIVVGTPGRVCDLLRRKKLKVDSIDWLVLDEADEMLTMGFKDELDAILNETSDEKRIFLFSATRQQGIEEMRRKFMDKPDIVNISKKNEAAKNIEHAYYVVDYRKRYDALKRLLDISPIEIYGIVFCRTRRDTQEIADELIKDRYSAEAIHGDLSQSQRERVMTRFRNKRTKLLIATDVAARGIDINDLTHVINYQLPDNLETYIHRSGRTGRAGKNGTAISILDRRERSRIGFLERKIGIKIEKRLVPTGKEICQKQLFRFADSIEKTTVDKEDEVLQNLLPGISQKLDWLSKEELVERLIALELERSIGDYKDIQDINLDTTERQKTRRNGRLNFDRFFINVGKKNKLTPQKLIRLINNTVRERDMKIGQIQILNNFSFFEVDSSYQKALLQSFKGIKFERVKVSVEKTKKDKRSRDHSSRRTRRR